MVDNTSDSDPIVAGTVWAASMISQPVDVFRARQLPFSLLSFPSDFWERMTATAFDVYFPGAPLDGEFRKQALETESQLGVFLQDMMSLTLSRPLYTPKELITVILMMNESRKAAKAQIVERAKLLPYIHRALECGREIEREDVKGLLDGVEAHFHEAETLFEVAFPPEDYRELEPEPKLRKDGSNKKPWLAWSVKTGVEVLEEERDPVGVSALRYAYDYSKDHDDWYEDFVEEMDRRHRGGTGPATCVYILPPGIENVVFGSFYQAHHTGPAIVAKHPKETRDHFSALPEDIKLKIARMVLVFPSKVAVGAEVFANGALPNEEDRSCFMQQMECATYKFSLHVKKPKFMIPDVTDPLPCSSDNYWDLVDPSTLLSLLAVNKEMHRISKPVFYSENYFEVKDGNYANRHRPTNLICGEQLAHHFFELMSWSEARDGTPRYGDRPLNLMRKINIDMDFYLAVYDDEDNGQAPWHFERIVDAIITIPHLNKLTINVHMSRLVELEALEEYWVSNLFTHPEQWPGWRRLPWAASALSSSTPEPEKERKVFKVFIPENRKVQQWLQRLMDQPGHDTDLVKDVDDVQIGVEDFDCRIENAPSELIHQGLKNAKQRWWEATEDSLREQYMKRAKQQEGITSV